MIRFLDMENATLHVNFQKISDIEAFFNINSGKIADFNFKRAIFEVSESDIVKVAKIVDSKAFGLVILKVKLSDIFPKTTLPKNVIVINTNEKTLQKNPKVFSEMILTRRTVETIAKYINEGYKIIVNPKVDVKNISSFNKNLQNLFSKTIGKNINIGNYILPTSIMREHPCNCYLCDGCHCKKKISMLPKELFVDKTGEVYPHGVMKKKFFIGNALEADLDSILKKYLYSREYKYFIKTCERVFIEFLSNYPYQYFPLSEYIKRVVSND